MTFSSWVVHDVASVACLNLSIPTIHSAEPWSKHCPLFSFDIVQHVASIVLDSTMFIVF